jgi:hypothetical protein
MFRKVKATYRSGVFVLEEHLDISEEAPVELIVQDRAVLPPEVKRTEERARILKEVTGRMQRHPLPAGAPDFTREELHARR